MGSKADGQAWGLRACQVVVPDVASTESSRGRPALSRATMPATTVLMSTGKSQADVKFEWSATCWACYGHSEHGYFCARARQMKSKVLPSSSQVTGGTNGAGCRARRTR